MKKLEKNKKIISRKMIFGQTYTEFGGCRGNIKSDGHTISN